tara:strand:+ start:95 stop:538 length:444 start_codon:yes stop_codon:yes gene_type:complete
MRSLVSLPSVLAAVALALLPTSSALVVAGGSASTRRALVQRVAGMAVATPLAAWADTQSLLKEPMQGNVDNEAKRAAFVKKQKVYKKQWRAALNDFDYASNDAESMLAVEAMAKARAAHASSSVRRRRGSRHAFLTVSRPLCPADGP